MMLRRKQFVRRDCIFLKFWAGGRLQITGNVNAVAGQFVKLVVQPFLILGGHFSDRNCMETKPLVFIAVKVWQSSLRAERRPFDMPAEFPDGVNTP